MIILPLYTRLPYYPKAPSCYPLLLATNII